MPEFTKLIIPRQTDYHTPHPFKSEQRSRFAYKEQNLRQLAAATESVAPQSFSEKYTGDKYCF